MSPSIVSDKFVLLLNLSAQLTPSRFQMNITYTSSFWLHAKQVPIKHIQTYYTPIQVQDSTKIDVQQLRLYLSFMD